MRMSVGRLVSNVWMMGVLNNDWEEIREEAVVAKFKKCAFVYLEAWIVV